MRGAHDSRGQGGSIEPSLFQCISMLAIAVGPMLTKYIHEILDFMLSSGLSESLCQALVDLVTHIPPLLPTIQGSVVFISD